MMRWEISCVKRYVLFELAESSWLGSFPEVRALITRPRNYLRNRVGRVSIEIRITVFAVAAGENL
jgi:hypothetical protein